MRILLTGGTGLIGRALCGLWQSQGHELIVWSRRPEQVPALCSGARGVGRLEELENSGSASALDAVVNLAGAPIADKPWTSAQRTLLRKSRVALTKELVDWLGRQAHRPRLLISGSAVGWYGDCGERMIDEPSRQGTTDFGSELCGEWEREALRAEPLGMRVVLLRTAPVLAPQGGMLEKLRLPFSLGLGGRLGSGNQWMPWIHIDDLTRLIDHVLQSDDCRGVFNACSPAPATNAEFTRALARALHRPAVLRVPAWALRMALGEMSVLLLTGQRAVPMRAIKRGFKFQHPILKEALAELLARRK
ncbi:TIGR01777 family oxidoreductase [Noviherbaspirillum galbum]|uniref:TIGR01777 family protein n=1 Tax=Noviherbaspirillum galbum TaxID=2709383 RepID=A0A6B3SNP4_9BURK|nr:TIGR01777 family oxidoreductase [Noviherbaspirillum galbum]NEX62118.1 TIGR01777 family protein [Noviherbaspirillum galbum]